MRPISLFFSIEMALFFFVLALLVYTVQGVPVEQKSSVAEDKETSAAHAVASIHEDSQHVPASLDEEIKSLVADIDKSLLLPLESFKFFVDTDFDVLQDPGECFDDMIVQLLPENLDVFSYPKKSSPKPKKPVSPNAPATPASTPAT